MVVLRLRRIGRKNLAVYRLVAADSRRPVKGKVIAELGHYEPHTKKLTFDKGSVERFIKDGAKPSNTVAKLLKKEGIKLPDWVEIVQRKRAPKKQQQEEQQEPKAKTSGEEPGEEKSEPDKDKTDEKDQKEGSSEEKPEEISEKQTETEEKPEPEKEESNKESEDKKEDPKDD